MSKDSSKHIRRLDEFTNEPVLDHEYDGIEELDNPLPGWWLATFYITIVFAAGYFTWHNIVGGANLHEKAYRAERAQIEAKIAEREKAQQAAIDPVAFAKEHSDPGLVAPGGKVFEGKCSSCHGPQGGGLIGPNLTDNFWIHGDGSALEVHKVVAKGVNDKGMPPWEALLSKEELKQVVAYVLSLKGSKPANPKAPQGQEVKS